MQLNFPAYNFNIKREENANYVFDILRKKYVLLTKEEFVRQHLSHFLVYEKGFPTSLLAVERGLEVNSRKKRFDLLAFNKQGKPLLLIECKSPDVFLSDETLMQIAIYNSHFECKYLLITNGVRHVLISADQDGKSTFSDNIPAFDDLI